ncbi:Transmembrane protein 68 [Xenotaenia resolanae]|uniref:Transmembrane protein 68 n=1 Tax=Xenotaenia resolanae TaxID=208358 RepID=A0ABV0VU05_9TELE
MTCIPGYEIHGMEKIPNRGPALIVYYHGAIPIDYYYFLSSVIIQKGRTCHSVADHFLFKIPGFKLLLEVFSVIHGPQEECVRALKNGHLLGISPGGVREALFSDETYLLFWGKRKGFAQVAIDSQVVRYGNLTKNTTRIRAVYFIVQIITTATQQQASKIFKNNISY